MKRAVVVLCFAAATLAAPSLAAARPDPVTWCGTDEVSANRVPDLDVAAAQQVRFVYAIPSDGTDNFLADASGIATDAAWIDQWWQGQDAARTPRFDRYPFPGCTSTFGALDIGFLRLPNPSSWYATPDTPSLRLDNDLADTFPTTQKTIVYFDGPTSNKDVCGETDYLANTQGGDNGIVYLYLRSGCSLLPTGSGGSAEVAAHELLHNLGAVPSGAPNECPTSAGHVCDSTTDVMDQFLRNGSTLDGVVLDFNRDDYYGEGNSVRWDVRDSSWLSHLPQFAFSLAVAGPGSLVAHAGSHRLPCDRGCTGLQLDNGERVSVTAVPSAGWKLASWSGGCSGASRSCTVSVDGPTTAAATFARLPIRLTVAVAGKGRVTSSPAGIACPGACRAEFAGSSVRLRARPAAGWRLAGWSGACRRTGPCTMTATGALRARFVRR